MCGIIASAGLVYSPRNRDRAMSKLAHRGPDDDATWACDRDHLWLGHRRLAIVDLSSAGRQPMRNESGTIHLVCNGEIYNHTNLRAALKAKGHKFVSESDNEVILHGYEEWGHQVVDRLEGMYAFVIWDTLNKTLFAARDRVGIKPLVYCEIDGGLAIASEAEALLTLLDGKISRTLSPTSLAYFLTLGYVPAPHCIWQGVSKLKPGHHLTWRPGDRPIVKRYWQPPTTIDEGIRDPGKAWPDIFERAVSDHLLSDVPVGLFLSAGLDSTSVAVALSNQGQTVGALTVSYPNRHDDESGVAADTARQLHFRHRIIPIDEPEITSLMRRTAAAFDEPQGYSALLSMYQLSESTAGQFKVVLAGDGGDEVFGGYNWYGNLRSPSLPSIGSARRLLRPALRRNSQASLHRIAMKMFACTSSLHRHAWRLFPRFLPEEAEALLAPLGLTFGDEEMLAPLRQHFVPSLPLKRALQRVDLMTFCTDSILAKVDRASMAHGLEVRVPFLDRRIVEWGLSTPANNAENHVSKQILRKYISGKVPQSVLDTKKQGFSLRALDRFDWDGAVQKIDASPLVRDGLLAPGWKNSTAPGMPWRNARIWTLFSLTCWAETHLGGSRP